MEHASQPTSSGRAKPLDEGTMLALKRTVYAADRTLLAWIRTSLSMISFGFTLVKLFDYLAKEKGKPSVGLFGRTWSPEMVGIAMMSIGIVALVLAVNEHWGLLKEYRAEGLEKRRSLTLLIAALIALLGVFALMTLVFGD